jgi:hypothetical protein
LDVHADDIRDPALRRLYLYWTEKRGGRSLPRREDIDPLDLRFLLGWINLVDVLREPLRFRFRVHGTMLVSYTGCDMTGKFLDEHPNPDHRAFLAKTWGESVEKGRPVHHLHDRVLNEQPQFYESIRLPIASDGETVDMLLIAAIHRGVAQGRSGIHVLGEPAVRFNV